MFLIELNLLFLSIFLERETESERERIDSSK
jgi:hypothetical protein